MKKNQKYVVINVANVIIKKDIDVCHNCNNLTKPKEVWFWSKVEKTDYCWNWVGSITGQGYGQIKVNYIKYLAHRISYEEYYGKIPNDLVIDHLCRNKKCVNPDHLQAVTNGVNVLRGISPHAINACKTKCEKGHELSYRKRNGTPNVRRYCKICNNESYKKWKKKNGIKR